MLYSYHEVGHLPKSFAQEIEEIVKKKMMENGDEISLKELALIVKVFCTSRSAHRNFHKLLETTVLMRIPELRQDIKTMHAIGFQFESSGLCSLDTLKSLKKEVFQQESE